jgi:hypothetical protein
MSGHLASWEPIVILRRPIHLAFPVLLLGAWIALAAGHSAHRPDPSLTGAPAIGSTPGEPDCSACHDNPSWSNVNTPGGAVEILDLPVFAADGKNGNAGDYVYTAADTVRVDPVPVRLASWGSLKARYR